MDTPNLFPESHPPINILDTEHQWLITNTLSGEPGELNHFTAYTRLLSTTSLSGSNLLRFIDATDPLIPALEAMEINGGTGSYDGLLFATALMGRMLPELTALAAEHRMRCSTFADLLLLEEGDTDNPFDLLDSISVIASSISEEGFSNVQNAKTLSMFVSSSHEDDRFRRHFTIGAGIGFNACFWTREHLRRQLQEGLESID